MAFRKISTLLQEVNNSVDIAEFVCKSIFGSFWIFVVTGQGKHAVSIGTIPLFRRVPGKC